MRARVDAPSPVNMSRDLPSAPPSPPDPAELDDSAPAATEFDALATVEQEVEKLDGVGDALTSESVADFAAADLAATERSESPAAKPGGSRTGCDWSTMGRPPPMPMLPGMVTVMSACGGRP